MQMILVLKDFHHMKEVMEMGFVKELKNILNGMVLLLKI